MALQYTVSGSVTVTITWENVGDLGTLKSGLAAIQGRADVLQATPSGTSDEMFVWKEMSKLADAIKAKIG